MADETVPEASLVDAVNAVAQAAGVISATHLAEEVARAVGADGDFAREFEQLLTADSVSETLDMRPGGWRVDIGATAAKTTLATVALSALLAIHGEADLPTYILPAVVPLLFDVRSARLDAADKLVLARLRAQGPPGVGLTGSLKSLYRSLPPDARAQLSELDFARFVDRLVAAGVADRAGEQRIALHAEGDEAWLRISWR